MSSVQSWSSSPRREWDMLRNLTSAIERNTQLEKFSSCWFFRLPLDLSWSRLPMHALASSVLACKCALLDSQCTLYVILRIVPYPSPWFLGDSCPLSHSLLGFLSLHSRSPVMYVSGRPMLWHDRSPSPTECPPSPSSPIPESLHDNNNPRTRSLENAQTIRIAFDRGERARELRSHLREHIPQSAALPGHVDIRVRCPAQTPNVTSRKAEHSYRKTSPRARFLQKYGS